MSEMIKICEKVFDDVFGVSVIAENVNQDTVNYNHLFNYIYV